MDDLASFNLDGLRQHRGRGVGHLRKRVGDLREVIRPTLRDHGRARVLEVGCGFGVVLAQLRAAYGERVELHGINKHESHGSWETAVRSAAEQGLVRPEELASAAPATFHYANVNAGLPLPSDYFHLAYSQVSFFYYDKKAFVLEELNRVLAPGGVALVDVMIERDELPPEYSCCFEIWKRGVRVSFWDYIARFENMERREGSARPYLYMKKVERLDLGLKLAHAIRLNDICKDWWGTKSVYRVRCGGAAG